MKRAESEQSCLAAEAAISKPAFPRAFTARESLIDPGTRLAPTLGEAHPMHLWQTTLLDLIAHLTEYIDKDEDVIAAAVSLINSGSVCLNGTFAGCTPLDISGERANPGWAFSSATKL